MRKIEDFSDEWGEDDENWISDGDPVDKKEAEKFKSWLINKFTPKETKIKIHDNQFKNN